MLELEEVKQRDIAESHNATRQKSESLKGRDAAFISNYNNIDVGNPTYIKNFEAQLESEDELNDVPDLRWRIHISILPDTYNLQLAAEALARTLSNKNIDYQLLKVPSQMSMRAWDQKFAHPQYAPYEGRSRAQELVLFLEQDPLTKQFSHTPEEYKNIILECLAALQEAKVEFGYTCTPKNEQTLPSESNLPEIVSLRSPTHESCDRHPWVYKQNPILTRDKKTKQVIHPLSGVSITHDDLRSHHINLDRIDEKRLQYLHDQLKDARQKLNEWFDDVAIPLAHAPYTQLLQLKKALKDLSKNQANNAARMIIWNQMPLDSRRGYVKLIDNYDLLQAGDQLAAKLKKIETYVKDETNAIIADFKKNKTAIAFIQQKYQQNIQQLTACRIFTEEDYIRGLIINDMNKMQMIFLRLCQLEYEELEYCKMHRQHEQQLLLEHVEHDQQNSKFKKAVDNFTQKLEALPSAKRDAKLEATIFGTLNSIYKDDDAPNNQTIEQRLTPLIDRIAAKGHTWRKVLGAFLIIAGILLGTAAAIACAASHNVGYLPAQFAFETAYCITAAGIGLTFFASGIALAASGRESKLHKDARKVVELAQVHENHRTL